MGPWPVIFVSAVSRELKSVRDLVARHLLKLGYEATWQDIFGTEQGDIRQMLREKIAPCAGVVQLVGQRYGFEPPAPDAQFGRVSYTQFEPLHARAQGKKVWYLLLDETYPTDPADPEPREITDLQLAYRERLRSETHVYHSIANPDALRATVLDLRDDLAPLRRRWNQWAALVLALLILSAGLGVRMVNKQTHTNHSIDVVKNAVSDLTKYVADPVNLRRRLEEKIEQSFREKHTSLLAANAPYNQIDELFRWHDRARSQVTEAVAFIVARAGDPKSTTVQQAGLILEEHGVDEALKYLDDQLKAHRQRRQEEGRQLAEAYMMKADLHESRLETAEQERAIRDAIADAPDWWRPHNNLGLILKRRAEWKSAEQEYEAARRTMGADGEAIVLNNLAALYQATNRLAEAEPLLERALQIHEKSFAPEYAEFATCLNNLATLYLATSRFAAAETLMERVLKIDEKHLRPEHPNVARDLNNLAALYFNTKRLAKAEPLMERALKIDEKSFGPEHPTVAIDLNNLAQLYKATNWLEEAEPLMERASKIDEKSLTPKHPNVAIRLNNLGVLYIAMFRFADAEPLLKRALTIDEESSGPENPDVARDRINLARLYQKMDRLEEAEPLMGRAAVIFLRVTKETGHPHPDLSVAIRYYKELLGKRAVPQAEIAQRLAEAGREASFSAEGFAALLKQLGE